MRLKYFIIAFLLTTVFVIPRLVSAESKTETYLGDAEMCLETVRIKETRIIDDQTVLFIMRSGELYLNRLPIKCIGLRIAGGFGYETSIAKLCKQDIVTTVGPGSAPGNTCVLGEFHRLKVEMKASDAVKLLEDGLLEELVAEGAFQEAFPAKE